MISRLLRNKKFNFLCEQAIFIRNLKTKAQETVKYTNTINLPKTTFPARLSSDKRKDVEENIRKVK